MQASPCKTNNFSKTIFHFFTRKIEKKISRKSYKGILMKRLSTRWFTYLNLKDSLFLSHSSGWVSKQHDFPVFLTCTALSTPFLAYFLISFLFYFSLSRAYKLLLPTTLLSSSSYHQPANLRALRYCCCCVMDVAQIYVLYIHTSDRNKKKHAFHQRVEKRIE